VARRALADATRNGLVLDELMAALRQIGDGKDPDLDPVEETR
jgi:hypothetical protein